MFGLRLIFSQEKRLQLAIWNQVEILLDTLGYISWIPQEISPGYSRVYILDTPGDIYPGYDRRYILDTLEYRSRRSTRRYYQDILGVGGVLTRRYAGYS